MNQKSIADRAGVSVATVSKAFSGSREISAETRDRIFAVARELNLMEKYDKNPFPKRVIALLCPEARGEYYNAYAIALNRELRARGMLMFTAVSDFAKQVSEEWISYLRFYAKVDGLILLDTEGAVPNRTFVPNVGISGHQPSDPRVGWIRVDPSSGIAEAIEALKKRGHREILFAGEDLTTRKHRFFLDALRRFSLPIHEDSVILSPRRYEEAGRDCAARILERPELPTAVIAGYDHIAIGLICAFRERGIRVPEDISVIGMDDIPVLPYFSPALSSIAPDVARVSALAVDLLQKKLENQFYDRNCETVPFHYIERASTADARNNT